eukprot:3203899-Rhodomonas_salina.6
MCRGKEDTLGKESLEGLFCDAELCGRHDAVMGRAEPEALSTAGRVLHALQYRAPRSVSIATMSDSPLCDLNGSIAQLRAVSLDQATLSPEMAALSTEI